MKRWFVLYIFCLSSCIHSSNDEELKTITVGSKINLMENAVIFLENDSSTNCIKSDSEYKIVTYANMYCEPCWNQVLQWKRHLNYFKEYPQISFYCYVHATLNDFKSMNANVKLNFPIFLDTRQRFRIVNRLSNNPNELTFLLNQKNEVLIIGTPFKKEMREKYLSIINTHSLGK